MEKKKTQKSVKKNVAKKTATKVVEKSIPVKQTKVTPEVVKNTIKNDHSLLKVLFIAIFVAIVLTWIIPSGTFSGATLSATTRTRTGINEMFLSIFYGANYYLVQLVFLLAVGIFYSVISKVKGYKAFIEKVAKMWKGKEKLFVLVNSLVIALMTSMFSQPLVVVIFIPMLYSVAKRLGLNKMSAIMMTFGALLIGLLGTTYGTYGVEYINSYMATTITTNIVVRFAILAIGYIALNIFVIMMNKKADNNSEVEELYPIVAEDKGNAIGYFITFAILFVISILAYVSWDTAFGITAFTDFHTWLTTTLKVGNYPIIGYILGNISAFGAWDLFTISAVLMFIPIIVKFAC